MWIKEPTGIKGEKNKNQSSLNSPGLVNTLCTIAPDSIELALDAFSHIFQQLDPTDVDLYLEHVNACS